MTRARRFFDWLFRSYLVVLAVVLLACAIFTPGDRGLIFFGGAVMSLLLDRTDSLAREVQWLKDNLDRDREPKP